MSISDLDLYLHIFYPNYVKRIFSVLKVLLIGKPPEDNWWQLPHLKKMISSINISKTYSNIHMGMPPESNCHTSIEDAGPPMALILTYTSLCTASIPHLLIKRAYEHLAIIAIIE
jgi:hypothetical protein